MMRPINVSLCSTTWELAKEKANFSEWVRMKLLEGRELVQNKVIYRYECRICKQKKDFFSQDMAWECNKCNVPLDFVTVIV